MSFKLNIRQKKLKFRKVASGNLKIGKLSLIVATWNFQELFVMQFDLKSVWFDQVGLKKKACF